MGESRYVGPHNHGADRFGPRQHSHIPTIARIDNLPLVQSRGGANPLNVGLNLTAEGDAESRTTGIPSMFAQGSTLANLPPDVLKNVLDSIARQQQGSATRNAFVDYEGDVGSSVPPIIPATDTGIDVSGLVPLTENMTGPQRAAAIQANQDFINMLMNQTMQQQLAGPVYAEPSVAPMDAMINVTGGGPLAQAAMNTNFGINQQQALSDVMPADAAYDAMIQMAAPAGADYTNELRQRQNLALAAELAKSNLGTQLDVSDTMLMSDPALQMVQGDMPLGMSQGIVGDITQTFQALGGFGDGTDINSRGTRGLVEYINNNPQLSPIQIRMLIESAANKSVPPVSTLGLNEQAGDYDYRVEVRNNARNKEIQKFATTLTKTIQDSGIIPNARFVSEADRIREQTIQEKQAQQLAQSEYDAEGGVLPTVTPPDTRVAETPVTISEKVVSQQEFDVDPTDVKTVEAAATEVGAVSSMQAEVDAAQKQFEKDGTIPQGFTYLGGQIVGYDSLGRVIYPSEPTTAPQITTATPTETATTTTTPVTPTTTVAPQILGQEYDAEIGSAIGSGLPSTTASIPTAADIMGTTPTGTTYGGGLGNVNPITGLPEVAYDLTVPAMEAFRRYRSKQLGETPMNVLNRFDLSAGYSPAYGRFLLNAATGNLPMVTEFGGEQGSGGFAEYLQSGQRRGLEDIRSSFGELQNYLRAEAANQPFDAGFGTYYGTPSRTDIVQSSLAALGSPALGQRAQSNLNRMFDLYQTQYGPQGASRFADFIGTAFNPVAMGGM